MMRLAIKALLVLACVVGAGVSGYEAAVRYLLVSSPQAVLALRPSDPELLTRLADTLFAADQQRVVEAYQKGQTYTGPDTSQRQLRLATAALRQQVLLPAALRQIGLAHDRGRVEPSTRPYLLLAEKLSRRERPTQLWLAQEALKTRNLDDAVAHLDTVFRTSLEAREFAWPLLLQAGELPGLGRALAGRSDMGAVWVGEYLQFLLQQNAQVETIADALEAIRQPSKIRDASEITAETVLRLALNGNGDRSLKLFQEARRSGLLPPPKQLFAGESATSLPWTLFGGSDAESDWRGTDSDSRALDLYASGGARLTVARQVRFDPPGQYRWTANLAEPTLPKGSRIEINLRCSGTAAPTIVWLAKSGTTPARPAVTRFSFPVGSCPVQVYSIDLVGADGDDTMTASLLGLKLERAVSQ